MPPGTAWIFSPVPIIAKRAYWTCPALLQLCRENLQNFNCLASHATVSLLDGVKQNKLYTFVQFKKNNSDSTPRKVGAFHKWSECILNVLWVTSDYSLRDLWVIFEWSLSGLLNSVLWVIFGHGHNHHHHRQPVCWEGAPCPAPRSSACTGRRDPAGPVSTFRIIF